MTEHDGPELAAQEPDWTPNPTLNPSAVPIGNGDWVSLSVVINFLVANGDSQNGAFKGAARALFSSAERGEVRLKGSDVKGGNPSTPIPADYFRAELMVRGNTIDLD